MEENINDEIIEHLMHPKNYGPLESPTGVGVGHSQSSGEFVILYIDLQDTLLQRISYATNGCHDTVIFGSMFTEMVQGATLEYALEAASRLQEEVKKGPPKQQACAQMVITAFEAALQHHRDPQDQELIAIEIGMECEIE